MATYFKYDPKNNDNLAMSHCNCGERVGYVMRTCNTEDEVKAALADGYTREMPQEREKPKKAAPKKKAKETTEQE